MLFIENIFLLIHSSDVNGIIFNSKSLFFYSHETLRLFYHFRKSIIRVHILSLSHIYIIFTIEISFYTHINSFYVYRIKICCFKIRVFVLLENLHYCINLSRENSIKIPEREKGFKIKFHCKNIKENEKES